jgi:large subunit ribosomal protein L23
MKHAGSVIKKIQVSEKAAWLSEKQNKYLFEVDRTANKNEIGLAVQEMFKVSVVGVNTMQYLGKTRRERTGRHGQRSDWKRAVVTLKKGDKIELA